jgi:hypothetical protein
MFSEIVKKPDGKNTVILSDSAGSLVPEGYSSLFKYRPAENLMKEILSLCADKMPQISMKKEFSGRVRLVLYADGSDVVNPIAHIMAGILSKKERNVFYLNLDELSDTDSWFSGNNEKGLSEMLYYVKAQKENLPLRAESCTSRDFDTGVDFMKGHKSPEDIGKLTPSECESLIRAIRGRNCYSDIILSRAFRYDALLPVLLKEADKIYLTTLDYSSSMSRLQKAADLLYSSEKRHNLDIKDKVSICINVFEKEQNGNIAGLPGEVTILPLRLTGDKSFLSSSAEYCSALEALLEKGGL